MTVWCTTVLPALLHLAKKGTAQIFYVFEDTALLAPNVGYKHVSEKTCGVKAGLFGYGYHTVDEHGKVTHFGTKGICATVEWCHQMMAVLRNTHFNDFKHWDMWLSARRRAKQEPAIALCAPLAGYYPRISLTARYDATYGGGWVPGIVDRDSASGQ